MIARGSLAMKRADGGSTISADDGTLLPQNLYVIDSLASQQAAMPPMSRGGGLGGQHRAMGGVMSPQQGTPWFTRQDARGEDEFHPGGMIASDVAGRTDRLPLAVGTDAHVLPADVVSGLGQGNSLAGANILNMALRVGPNGVPLPRGGGRADLPRAPAPARGLAEGGMPGTGQAKILAAGGEYIVPAWRVKQLGANARATGKSKAKDDFAAGHEVLNKFIASVRAHNLKFLKNAPAPKK
jgi:hypothetical protein